MTADEVEQFVGNELREFLYELPEPGTAIGIPWSREKVEAYVTQLKGFLVRPYLREFLLSDTYEQFTKPNKQVVQYWVVVETKEHYEFYDPSEKNFGLAEPVSAGKMPSTIGVRGDLVGVFCAM